MRDIVDIVEDDIINKMNNVINVKSFVGNVLTVCGVKWARDNKTVTDSLGNEFKITDVNHDTLEITLTPVTGPDFSGKTLDLPFPSYFFGTPISTNKEWGNFDADEKKKVPFIWLVEPTSETLNPEDNPIERNSDLVLVFLDSNNIEQWRTEDTHSERLRSLYNMVEEFINAINKNTLFEPLVTKRIKNYTKFGKETVDKGFEKNIIDANLTGIELRLTLLVNKEDACNC